MKGERIISAYKTYFKDFIDTLNEAEARKVFYVIDMLKTQERVNARFVKYLRDEIYELRAEHGGNGTENTNTESTLHSEQYDSMFRQKTSVESSLAQTKQDINFYTSRRDALQNNKASSKANVDKVEADIADLSKKVEKLVDLTQQTASDYYENVQFANAYNILVPATKSVGAGLSQAASEAVKTIVIVEFLIFAVYLAVAFIAVLKSENSKKRVKAGADDDDDDDEDIDLEELVDVIEEEAEKAEKQTNVKKNKKK